MKIDWKRFLLREFPNGKITGHDKEYNIDCISPHCPNPKNHMFVNLGDNKKFNCRRCNYSGNHVGFLITYFKLPYQQILDNLADLYGLEKDFFSIASENLKEFYSSIGYEEENDIEHFVIDLPFSFQKIQTNTKYLKDRLFPEWALTRYDIGLCREGYYRNRIIFPLITDRNKSFLAYSQDSKKKLKGYKNLSKKFTKGSDKQLFYEKKSRKILYPSKSITSMLLFNYGSIKIYETTVILVEGVMDAIRLMDFGHKAVAKLGGSLSDEQCRLLSDKDIGEIIYMPDSDISLNDIIKTTNKIRDFCESDVSYVKLKSGDPDDLRSKKELTRIINDRIRQKSFYKGNDLSLF